MRSKATYVPPILARAVISSVRRVHSLTLIVRTPFSRTDAFSTSACNSEYLNSDVMVTLVVPTKALMELKSFSSRFDFEISFAKIARGPAPSFLSFASRPTLFQCRAGHSLFLFARNFFLFLFLRSRLRRVSQKKKSSQKKFFNVGVVGAKRTIFRLLLHIKIFDLIFLFYIHSIIFDLI